MKEVTRLGEITLRERILWSVFGMALLMGGSIGGFWIPWWNDRGYSPSDWWLIGGIGLIGAMAGIFILPTWIRRFK